MSDYEIMEMLRKNTWEGVKIQNENER
jgi:hypothetical protein